jgi:hypothetical protein
MQKLNTKIIRLEWSNGDGITFEDFEVSKFTSKEDIQYCINVALKCRENECDFFKSIMQKKGFFCEYHRPITEIYNFDMEV